MANEKKPKDVNESDENESSAQSEFDEQADESGGSSAVGGSSAAGGSPVEELKEQLLRQAAEYDNYRKRTAKERMDLEPELTSKILTKLLPVLDNLERALACECSDSNFKKGVELINESFLSTLFDLGVQEIKTDGEDFNPIFHQAVGRTNNPDIENEKIVETFQKGYKIGEKVIRFAMVSVNMN
ncbi:MAG: nucleotide exchange factor GrpE [Oscillospiraceae bacterium]|nr:nucleotide exchange factor GrpE [Oscillospiraceae bacterium]